MFVASTSFGVEVVIQKVIILAHRILGHVRGGVKNESC
jgi:hypothetical protein